MNAGMYVKLYYIYLRENVQTPGPGRKPWEYMTVTYIFTRSAPHSWNIPDFPAMGSGLKRSKTISCMYPGASPRACRWHPFRALAWRAPIIGDDDFTNSMSPVVTLVHCGRLMEKNLDEISQVNMFTS